LSAGHTARQVGDDQMDDYTKNTYAGIYSAFDADQIEIIETDFPNETILRMAHLTVRVSFLDDVVTYFTEL
jgi:hypothetical protein